MTTAINIIFSMYVSTQLHCFILLGVPGLVGGAPDDISTLASTIGGRNNENDNESHTGLTAALGNMGLSKQGESIVNHVSSWCLEEGEMWTDKTYPSAKDVQAIFVESTLCPDTTCKFVAGRRQYPKGIGNILKTKTFDCSCSTQYPNCGFCAKVRVVLYENH
jgi:hypothetical protein